MSHFCRCLFDVTIVDGHGHGRVFNKQLFAIFIYFVTGHVIALFTYTILEGILLDFPYFLLDPPTAEIK